MVDKMRLLMVILKLSIIILIASFMHPAQATVSPIVYVSDLEEKNNWDVYILYPDENNSWKAPVRLTTSPSIDNHPDLSPDGKMIVFSSNLDGDYDIYKSNITTANDSATWLKLTNDTKDNENIPLPNKSIPDRHPHFSSNGEWIVYTAKYICYDTTETVVDQCSIPVRVITVTCGRQGEGLRIIRSDGSEGPFEINSTRMNTADTLGVWPDDPNITVYIGHPSFSPDDNQILFSASIDGNGSEWEVYVVNWTGGYNVSNLRRVTNGTNYPQNPNPIQMSAGAHFTHDGSKIVFSSTRTKLGNSQLFMVDANASDVPVSEERRLTYSCANDYVPEPQEDGRIIFTSDRGFFNITCDRCNSSVEFPTHDLGIFIMDPDGYKQTSITDDDSTNELLLIGDEVSWFCGIQPNLAPCVFYPKTMTKDSANIMREMYRNASYLPNFSSRDLYPIYWQNVDNYMNHSNQTYWRELQENMNRALNSSEISREWIVIPSLMYDLYPISNKTKIQYITAIKETGANQEVNISASAYSGRSFDFTFRSDRGSFNGSFNQVTFKNISEYQNVETIWKAPSEPGIYNLTLIVTNENGSMDKKEIFVTIYADEWPIFHHDLALSGYSTSIAPDTNDVLWIYNTGSDIRASPAIAGGKLYIGALNGMLYALDANTSSLIWRYQTGGPIYSSPAVAYGKVYVLSTDGYIYALDADNGNLIWSRGGMGGPWSWSSPAVRNGRVFIAASGSGLMHSLDANTGAIIWNASVGGTPNGPITVVNGKVYSGTHNFDTSSPTLVAINEINGTITWVYNYTSFHPPVVGMINSNGAAVVDGDGDGDLEVYFGVVNWNGTYNTAIALDEATGAEVWTANIGGWSTSTPAVHNGRVFIGSDDYNLYALDARTGAKIWNFTTNAFVWASPSVADGKVFFGSLDHIFYALNETTGSLIWSYNTSQSRLIGSPAVAYGKVFVGNENGKIYAFGSAIVSGSNQVYVPWTATTQGWTTPFVIANKGNSSASVNIRYYNQADGSYVGTYFVNNLQPGASTFVFREWTTSNTDGSAVLVSDQPISVMVDQFNNGQNKFGAYEVEPSGANWLFLPWTATTQGWTTPYVIVNRGTTNSTQGMTYFNIMGLYAGSYSNEILPGASKFVFREWTVGGDGGVYMNSTQPVSVLVDMFKNSENKFGAYTPASTLSNQVFIPWTATTQNWSTPFKIFNGGADSAIVTIVYFNQADGLIAGYWNVSIAPQEVVTVYRENSTANGTDGSAVLNSTQPISVIVEQFNNNEGKFEVYTPAMTASNTIVIPWTATTQGWTTPYVIVNRGTGTANLNITYYNQADGHDVGNYSTTILPGASKFVFREWTLSASTTDGSAVVVSDQPITVMVDQFNNAQNKFGAYTPIG